MAKAKKKGKKGKAKAKLNDFRFSKTNNSEQQAKGWNNSDVAHWS